MLSNGSINAVSWYFLETGILLPSRQAGKTHYETAAFKLSIQLGDPLSKA